MTVVELSPISVREGDPLTISVKWKNYKLEAGAKVNCVVLFMGYIDGEWEFLEYKYGNKWYYWGCYVQTTAPYKGMTVDEILKTYVVHIATWLGYSKINCGVYVIFTPPENIDVITDAIFRRIIGLNCDDVDALDHINAELFTNKFVLYRRS